MNDLIKFDKRALDEDGLFSDYLILSIDGGGMRGIIPSVILTRIEEEIGGKISQVLDCLSGSSTGGIIALALTKPNKQTGTAEFNAQDLVDFYKTRGKDIFYRSWWHTISSLNGYYKPPKYPEDGVEKVLNEKFGKIRLNEALNDIMITSFDMQHHKDYIFTSFKKSNNAVNTSASYLMSDVARSTCAAPYFFSPKCLIDDKDPTIEHNFIDGGIIANNPAEWSELITNSKLNLEKRRIFILSLGTGQEPKTDFTNEETNNWTLLNWIQPLFNTLFDMMDSTVEEQLKLLSVNHDISYLRLEVKLDKKYSLDDYDPVNLQKMEDFSNKYFDKLLQSGLREKLLIPLQNRLHSTPL